MSLQAIQAEVGSCREWLPDEHRRCGAPSEFVLWGKLFPLDALGPRCYDHAAAWAGHQALTDPSYAIINLKRLAERSTV